MPPLNKRGKRGGGIWLLLLLFFLFYLYHFPLYPEGSTIFLDQYGDPLTHEKEMGYVSEKDIPENLKAIVIPLEDKRFFAHFGIDPLAILRALRFNLSHAGKVQGASTIDQQVIKIRQQAYKRSRKQKIKEAFLATNLNLHYKKEEILLYYINNVEFLNGVRGYRSACRQYFHSSCEALWDAELLFLASIVQSGKNPMKDQHFSYLKKKSAIFCKHHQKKPDCSNRNQRSPRSREELFSPKNSPARHYKDYLLKQEKAAKKGKPVHQKTSFELPLYQEIDTIISYTQPYRTDTALQDCCVLVLNGSWEIRSMNSCRSYEDPESWQINSCIRKRQTGSTIKPFLYLFAMKKLDKNGESIILDAPVNYRLDDTSLYTPRNFSLSHQGEISWAAALGNSLNIPAVKLVHEVGVASFLDFLRELREHIGGESWQQISKDEESFHAEDLGLSIALGTYEMSPLQFARLRKIFFEKDSPLVRSYKAQIDEVFKILTQNNTRSLSFGEDNFLDMPGWASKSGTSRHFVDGRSCWASRRRENIVCVWAGNHNASPMKESWALTAGYLWNLVVDLLERR